MSEQAILDVFERGKAFGFAEGMRSMRLKDLTDEDITKVAQEIFKDYKNFHHYQIDFAKAILKKAQEK